MFTAYTQPHTFMAGYASVPLRIYSDDVTSSDKFKYLVNIGLSSATVTGATSYAFMNNAYTKLSFDSEHDFSIGDSIMIDDSANGNNYSNFYNVAYVTDSTSIVADFTLGPAFTGNSTVYKVIPYKFDPDLQNEAKIDLSNTLKNYVTQNLEDTNEIFEAPDTRLEYDILIGKEAEEVFSFYDNIFVGGNVGFAASGLSSSYTASTTFKIGDTIVIEQNLVEWPYYDNFFYNGELAFTSTTVHNFRTGQTVTITGQITQPSYNGPVQVRNVINNYSFSTYKPFTTSTPAEAGKAIGIPRPEYNGTATIIDIYWDNTYGVIFVTDKAFTDSSQAIGGTIKFANENLVPTVNDLKLSGLSVYNAKVNTLDYGFTTTQFDPYVCQNRAASLNNISTILGNTERYRIEQTTKSWLLAHSYDSTGNYWEPRISFYNNSGSLLSMYRLNLSYQFGPQVDINSYTNNGGFVRLNCFSAHNLQVGDIIEIFQSPYNGVATVTSIQSTTQVTVNIPFVSGSSFGAEYFKKINSSGHYDYHFPIGLDQINANTNKTKLSGSTLSTILDSVDYYKVELEQNNSANTNAITFEINTDCSRYELFHLMWKDARGSWLSYPFKYISNESTEVDRKNYYQTEGRWNTDNNTFGFDTYGRGERTYFSRSRDKYTLNSGWVEEFENDLIKDLMESSAVYMQLPDNTLVAAQITNRDIQLRKKQSDYLWNYSFEVRVSNNEVRY